ncbi:HET-domain-containing protein [Xylariomycetidae sp. FL0641]|nr:HET-domain-containing protein [Xylariomycetidae sp. FL0641]
MMAAIVGNLLDNLSIARYSRSDPSLIVLPTYWNHLHKLRVLWRRREPCPDCGWDGNPMNLLRIAFPSEKKPKILFKRSKLIPCISCDIELRLLDSLPEPDLSSLNVFRWINQTKPCIRLETALFGFEEEDREWNFLIPPGTGKAVAGIPQGSLFSGDTESDAALEWTKHHLSTCLRSHGACRVQNDLYLPTRLVFTGQKANEVRLVDRLEIPQGSRYLALSHCWGSLVPECLTLRSNIQSQRRNIPWKSLPKTFQEAIIFARKLGMSYVWIDSLCIIQRDTEDWLQEAGQMFHVYQNAFLTIGASHARDGSEGLFSRQTPGRQTKLATLRSGSQHCDLYAQQSLPENTSLYHFQHSEPLFRRGWTFQERLVSPRILYFTKEELVWECYETSTCECGFHNNGPHQPVNLKIDYVNSLTGRLPAHRISRRWSNGFLKNLVLRRTPGEKDLMRAEAEANWRSVVGYYSRLHLTNGLDRLLAIGAIAEQVSQIRPGQNYLAGLWSGSLEIDLLWKAAQEPTRGRIIEHRVPTWSWTSVSGKVSYPWVSPMEPCVEVLETKCDYVDGNCYGLAAGGRLVLRGRSIQCTLRELAGADARSYQVQHPGLGINLEASLDRGSRYQGLDIPNDVYLLLVAETIDFPSPVGLLLENIQAKSDVFARIGLFEPPGTRLQDQQERQTLMAWYGCHSRVREFTVV